MTEMWHVGCARCNFKKIHWAGKNEKSDGPESTGLAEVVNVERWGHYSMELGGLEGGARHSV